MTEDLIARIDARLLELSAEKTKLEAARAALAPAKRGRPTKIDPALAHGFVQSPVQTSSGTTFMLTAGATPAPKRRGRPKKSAAAKKVKTQARGNGRGRRTGKFQTALVEHIRKHPEGLSAAQIASGLGCDPKQPYPALKKAAERGEVVKEDKIWKPVLSG